MNRLFEILIYLFFLAVPVVSLAGTYLGWGVDSPEHAQGLSLRDERASGGGLFFVPSRSHTGGGLSGGK
jgi:hypothetical protein